MKLYTQVITVQNESARSTNMHKELEKLRPWCELDVHQFNTPCKNYQGSSDNNKCVQQNLYENHQKCAQNILSTNLPYGLVLESDFLVMYNPDQLSIYMTALEQWLTEHNSDFDLFVFGANHSADKQHAWNNKFICHMVYHAKTHAVIYSRDFCKNIVKTPWPGSHFDLYWSRHRMDIRAFGFRKMVIGVNSAKHMMEMKSDYRMNVLNVILPQIYMTNTVRLSFVALVTITMFLMFYNAWGFSKR